MTDVIIQKKNEVYLTVECEPHIKYELSEYFTFEVPNAKFMPQYKKRLWDGTIKLFSPGDGKIYCGLYSYLTDWLDVRGYTYEDKDNNYYGMPNESNDLISPPGVVDYVKSLHIPFAVRDYQREAFIHAIKKSRCLLLSPTASGKSLIVYLITRFNLIRLKNKKQNKVLIIVPTTSLVEQLTKDFKDYGWNSETNVHKIYQGHEKDTDKRVIISTWQSIYNLPKAWFKQFGTIVGDEAHLFKAVSLTKIMSKLEQCKYRYGLTGTLDGTKTHKLVLEGLFGTVNKVISTAELQEKKQLADLKIYGLILGYDNGSRQFVNGLNYQEEMDFLVAHEKRNKFIVNLAAKLTGNTLCLFQYVEKHGAGLYEDIKNKADNKKVFYVYGGVEAEDREQIREVTEKSDNAVIVASYGTFSTGINIRNLHNIIFASPSKSRIRNLQSIGRGLRLKDNKSKATLYDIADDLTFKEKENYTLSHFRERININNEEEFDYEIHNVDLTK